MEGIVKHLTTGDVIVFERTTRDLFIIPPRHVAEWDKSQDKTGRFARELAERGHALHFDRAGLRALQDALGHIPVLG